MRPTNNNHFQCNLKDSFKNSSEKERFFNKNKVKKTVPKIPLKSTKVKTLNFSNTVTKSPTLPINKAEISMLILDILGLTFVPSDSKETID